MVDLERVKESLERENHPYFNSWWRRDVEQMVDEIRRLRPLAYGYNYDEIST